MENLNLVELLRDCPTGMELDSTVFDNITFDYVNTQQNRVYCKVGKSESVWFTPRGGVNLLPDAKCVIFPKGKTTWEGFVPPIEFKDGDFLAINSGIQVFILQRAESNTKGYCYIGYDFEYNEFFDAGVLEFDRLATEEEKQKLFDAIKANGYRWNSETKTLEKLPKFKVGDRIRHKTSNKDDVYEISKVYDDSYGLVGFTWMIYMKYQDQYELVPNKFDITTLKPFDKVLARDCNEDKWNIDFFGCYRDNGTYQCMTFTKNQCIPYENNEHLLDTTDDCDPFFKTWEK